MPRWTRWTLLPWTICLVIGLGLVLLRHNLPDLFWPAFTLLVPVLSTLVIAAPFVPLRERLSSGIDRRFSRHRCVAARTFAAFVSTLRELVELDALTGRLLDVVEETAEPASVTLWIGPADRWPVDL